MKLKITYFRTNLATKYFDVNIACYNVSLKALRTGSEGVQFSINVYIQCRE